MAPYIDSQIRQLRKQRLRGEAWVTCEVKYKKVKQKKTNRMLIEEGILQKEFQFRETEEIFWLYDQYCSKII